MRTHQCLNGNKQLNKNFINFICFLKREEEEGNYSAALKASLESTFLIYHYLQRVVKYSWLSATMRNHRNVYR